MTNATQEAQDLPPTPTTKEEKQRFRAAAGRLFGAQWLELGQHHRLQRLWARKDELALMEIVTLGHAIEALEGHDKWLRDTARAARDQPVGSHGHIFEIMMLGGLAAAGAQVQPMPARTAGYDAQITLPDGHVLRASIKNRDLSTHEAAFRQGCQRLDAIARARVASSGGAWSLAAGSVTHMSQRTLQALADQMMSMPLAGQGRHHRLPEGEAAIQSAPLRYPGVLPPSYQLVVRSPAHVKEQANFRSRLVKAIEAFALHSPLSEQYSNVIFMRAHSTADVDALRGLAAELLQQPGCAVDAVFFMQPAVAREGVNSVISYYMPVVQSGRFRERRVKLAVTHLGGKQIGRPTALQLMTPYGLLDDVTGQYLFQRGHLYYPLVNGAEAVSLATPGPGIQTSAVYREPGGAEAHIAVRRADDEELLVL
jgi:hypothetical protein